MIIKLSPLRDDKSLSVNVTGDAITINGEVFDFTQLPDGATLPVKSIKSGYFAGPVERINGQLYITLYLPHGANPPRHVAFPETIYVTQDGPVKLPTDEVKNVD